MIRWDAITGNLSLISQKLVEHVLLTVTAVGIGLILSFLAVLAIRRWRRLAGPITGIAGAIYTIPSLALLVFLIPITRLSGGESSGEPSGARCPPMPWATAPAGVCGRWSCRWHCRSSRPAFVSPS